MIRSLRPFKNSIVSLWISILVLSMGLIVTHDHHHEDHGTSCHTTEESHDQHDHHADCQYCFLYFQQGISLQNAFHWDATPVELEIKVTLSEDYKSHPYLKPFYSKGLRAPPILLIPTQA